MATIYHGTPLTPRDALLSVCAGRAMCVSFYRPDDVEAVEAISPAIMFRFRRVLVLASGYARRTGVGRSAELGALLRMVGAPPVSSGEMGGHAGYAGGAIPAQRQPAANLAFRAEGGASLAHGRPDRALVASLRPLRPGLFGMDRPEGRLARLPCTDARGRSGARQSLACSAHAPRNGGGLRLPVPQRGQHLPRAERVAL